MKIPKGAWALVDSTTGPDCGEWQNVIVAKGGAADLESRTHAQKKLTIAVGEFANGSPITCLCRLLLACYEIQRRLTYSEPNTHQGPRSLAPHEPLIGYI